MSDSGRVAQEIEFFKDMDLNALPEIYSYWSNTHLIHFIHGVFDSYNLFEVFAAELGQSIKASGNSRIVSIGAGDAEIDVMIAEKMLGLGYSDFQFECLELSSFLIERARQRIAGTPLEQHFVFTEVDLSEWQPEPFGACFAHHSLHHIVALEHVFDQIKAKLAPGGSFLTSDMIGRNGHMRWPEVFNIITGIWAVVPEHWKQNRPLQRVDRTFVNWDCSTHGFEGVRAQDILPMLVSRFHFHKLAAWGGILDPFIERVYGHNFDVTKDFDRNFVDLLWQVNRNLIKLGVVKPTQMIAVMKNEAGQLRSADDLDPHFCIREPDAESSTGAVVGAVEQAAAPADPAQPGGTSGPGRKLGGVLTRLRSAFTKAPVQSSNQNACILESHSGTWFDPGRRGEGLQIEIGDANGARTLLATWNTYQNGQQLWITGANELPPGTAEIDVDLVRTYGANFGSSFRPEDVRVQPWGTLHLSVSGPAGLNVRYTMLDGTKGAFSLQRMLSGA